jgi:hypothetical protein
VSLRNTKAELAKKTEELVDLQEEMAQFKETSKQREQHLKAKARAAIEERDKLAGVEVRCTFSARLTAEPPIVQTGFPCQADITIRSS